MFISEGDCAFTQRRELFMLPILKKSKLVVLITGVSGTVDHAGFHPTAKWPYSQRIDFNSPFDGIPTITYGLYRLDSSDETNLRVATMLTNVSSTGFQLTLQTWSGSELYEAAISWMACGK